jgi:hypothetical protein
MCNRHREKSKFDSQKPQGLVAPAFVFFELSSPHSSEGGEEEELARMRRVLLVCDTTRYRRRQRREKTIVKNLRLNYTLHMTECLEALKQVQ